MSPRNQPADTPRIAARSARRSGRSARAFSLFEMLVVLAILGVLAGIALPYFSSTAIDDLQATAAVVVADVDYARSLAISNGSDYRLTFEPAQNRYQLTHVGTNPLLNTLPTSPFKSPTDTATTQTTRLDHLPFGENDVRLVGALRATGSTAELSEVTFTSLGGTNRAEDTLIWLVAGRGTGRRYLAVRVSAATGLATVEPLASTAPTGMAALSSLP